jgi:hypothetical protein
MATFNDRLTRIERQRGDDGERRNQVEADATWVLSRIAALAAASKNVVGTQQDRARWIAFSDRFMLQTGRGA